MYIFQLEIQIFDREIIDITKSLSSKLLQSAFLGTFFYFIDVFLLCFFVHLENLTKLQMMEIGI